MSLTELMAPVWAELKSLSRRVPSVSPATVTSVNPVRIQMDGSGAPLSATPDVGVTVGLGSRVRVIHHGTTHLIVAVVSGHEHAWSGLSLTNGAVAVSVAQARLKGGLVHLRGEVTFPNDGFDRPLTTLPARYRPPHRMRFAWGWNLPGGNLPYVGIETDGRLWASGTRTTSPGFFLDAIPPYEPADG